MKMSIRPFREVWVAFGRARSSSSHAIDAGGSERHRRILLSVLSDLVARSMSVAGYILVVRLTLNHLGTERFGLFATLCSFVTLLSFADLGIGNGTLNLVARAVGRNDVAAVRRYIGSALIVLLAVGAVVLTLGALALLRVDWREFYRLSVTVTNSEAQKATGALLVGIALGIPAMLIYRVQLALQQGYLANLWQAAGSFLGTAMVFVLVSRQASLAALVASYVGTPLIVALANACWFFGWRRPDLRPILPRRLSEPMHEIFRTGALFLALQTAAAIAYFSDSFVIARTIGAGEVATYALCATMFSIIQVVMSVMLTPIWPAYGEAIARRDLAWTRAVLKLSLVASIAVPVLLSLPLLALHEWILEVWTGRVISPPVWLLLGFAAWRLIEALGTAASIYLNASNVILPQVIVAVFMCSIAIALKFAFIPVFGVAGAVWATIFAYFIVTAVPQFLLVRKALLTQQ